MTPTAQEKLQGIIQSSEFQTYYQARTLATDLAVKIKMTREKLGWSQAELARKMGIEQSAVARMESGAAGINATTLEKFCSATGVVIQFSDPLTEKKPTSNALDVCRYILDSLHERFGLHYDVSNLKLHKLLYFVQKESVQRWGEPLMLNMFQAWEHGPVYRGLYSTFKSFGNGPIPPQECKGKSDAIHSQQKQLIDAVLHEYGHYSAWGLRELTHKEAAYLKAWKKGKNTAIVF